MKSAPETSIVIRTKNEAGSIGKTLDALFSQTYKNFEFIIVDDASTDNSLSVIKKYQKRYPKKIKVLAMKKTLNCGGDFCANKGIAMAKGKYIARMDPG